MRIRVMEYRTRRSAAIIRSSDGAWRRIGSSRTPASRATGLGATLLVLMGCGDPVGPGENTEFFATDQAAYRLEANGAGLTAQIPFTFVNRTGSRIFVLNCNRISTVTLEKDVDGQWAPAWAGGTPDCLSPPIELRVGDRFTDTLHVFAGHPNGIIEPKFEIQPPRGRYRLVWSGLFRSAEDATYPYGPEIAKALRVSTPFEILEP